MVRRRSTETVMKEAELQCHLKFLALKPPFMSTITILYVNYQALYIVSR